MSVGLTLEREENKKSRLSSTLERMMNRKQRFEFTIEHKANEKSTPPIRFQLIGYLAFDVI